MSTQQIQEQRKGQAILEAAQIIERAKPDAERLSLAMNEVLAPDEYRLAALVYELTEMVARSERALDHIGDHVVAAQDAEIRALKKRVAELEEKVARSEDEASPAASAAPSEPKKKKQ